MKKMKCDLCEFEAQGETFEEWMSNLKPHYAEAHQDFIAEKMKLPEKEQMAEMGKWVEENKKRFDST